VILPVIAGAGTGLGLLLLAVALFPSRPTLAASLARLDAAARHPRRAASLGVQDAAAHRLLVRYAGQPLATAFLDRGWLAAGLRSDIAIVGQEPASFFAGKAACAVAGLAFGPLLAGLFVLTGVGVPVLLPGWVAILLAGLLFTVPDMVVRRRAQDRRRDFRAAVGSYLDLVAMKMASGAGLSEALRDAAAVGGDGPFARIRGALEDARTDGLTPPAAIGQLGDELGLPDLRELSAGLSLVASSGAQAEESLRAKAASLRERELSAAAGDANARSQSMLVAQVVLALGFLVFIGYPALAKVLVA
jgi:tight adherence protein C